MGEWAPLEMLPQLYFDSITLDLEILKLLIERAGPDKVMLGSDYPFLMDYEPYSETLAYIRRSELPPADIEQIMQRSASELFGGRLLTV